MRYVSTFAGSISPPLHELIFVSVNEAVYIFIYIDGQRSKPYFTSNLAVNYLPRTLTVFDRYHPPASSRFAILRNDSTGKLCAFHPATSWENHCVPHRESFVQIACWLHPSGRCPAIRVLPGHNGVSRKKSETDHSATMM